MSCKKRLFDSIEEEDAKKFGNSFKRSRTTSCLSGQSSNSTCSTDSPSSVLSVRAWFTPEESQPTTPFYRPRTDFQTIVREFMEVQPSELENDMLRQKLRMLKTQLLTPRRLFS